MKKTIVVLTSIFAILLGACSQIPGLSPTAATGPNVDAAATSDAQFKTAVVQTLTAQAPTLLPAAATNTAVIVEPSATDSALATFTPIDTLTLAPNLTTTPPTATIGSASAVTASPTSTATLAAGQPVPTWTLGVRTYGTLPPEVPFNRITLINKAKAEAYISLHVDLDGSNTVIEYPVEGAIKIKAPIGSYSYVAWVGGRKMVGTFRLTANDDITITLYKDRVVIK